MDWATGIAFVPRHALAVGAYGLCLVAVAPMLAQRQWFLPPALLAMATLGTMVYVRYGVLVLTAPCRTCGQRAYVGAVRCLRCGSVRPVVARPVVQAIVVVGLFVVLGVVAGTGRTLTLSLAAPGTPVGTFLRAGDPTTRSAVTLASLVASVPIPVLVGTAIRLHARSSGTKWVVAR